MEADLRPNTRFGLQTSKLRRKATGNMSLTRFNKGTLVEAGTVLAASTIVITTYVLKLCH